MFPISLRTFQSEGVLHPNGCVYGVPSLATKWLKYTPGTYGSGATSATVGSVLTGKRPG